MGFPIRTNIFRPGSPAQKHFSRFPIQVAILFSPTDVQFVGHLHSTFLALDRSTGSRLAFFAVLDPPEDWLQEAASRRWWTTYQEQLGALSFSADDRVLMREIGRLFGLRWNELPQVVASPNLWTGEHVSCPTSADHLGAQIDELTRLAERLTKPNIGHIADTLDVVTGGGVRYHAPSAARRQRLSEVYDTLQMLEPGRSFGATDFRYSLGRQLDAVDRSLDELRRSSSGPQAIDAEEPDPEDLSAVAIDAVLEDNAGRLVAYASVAARVAQRLRMSDLPELLEEESAVMIETAIRVGTFLEGLSHGGLGELNPLGRRRPYGGYGPRGERHALDVDFAPGAQGAWKALEYEVNLSVVQAARAARTIPIPTYFALHYAGISQVKCFVITGHKRGQPVGIDINQREWPDRASGRHMFLSLGDSFHLVNTMINSPGETLAATMSAKLGHPFPVQTLDQWRTVQKIRNLGSHVHRLGQADYEKVLDTALAPAVMEPLLRLKRGLRNG